MWRARKPEEKSEEQAELTGRLFVSARKAVKGKKAKRHEVQRLE